MSLPSRETHTKLSSKPQGFRNKRNNVRVEPDLGRPIKIDINGENFIDVLNARDISEGGVGISVPHAFVGCSIDKPVQFIIELPKPFGRMFVVKGVIKHTMQDRFGVCFTNIDARSRQWIRDYISYRIQCNEGYLKSLAFRCGLVH